MIRSARHSLCSLAVPAARENAEVRLSQLGVRLDLCGLITVEGREILALARLHPFTAGIERKTKSEAAYTIWYSFCADHLKR
jgi:hypothetical protein